MTSTDELLAGATHVSKGHTTHPRGWHLSSDAVICDFGRQDRTGVAWQMLAYGLEYVARHQRGRLVLVLPSRAARITSLRAALLRRGLVEVWQYGRDGQISSVPIPKLAEALPAFGRTRPGVEFRPDPRDTEGLPDWLRELGDWIESRAVERQRTRGYWAWHYRGRAVLTVWQRGEVKTTGYRVLAGVKYSGKNIDRFGDDTFIDFAVGIGNDPTDEQLEAARRQVDAAIERRRTRIDAGHREHMLQAAIARDPSLVGMRYVRRELAAGRLTAQSSCFIDFLGIDDDGQLHIIETKLGHDDVQLGIQGLDYWAWAMHHKDELCRRLTNEGYKNVDAAQPITLRFVIGAKVPDRALHDGARATIAALHGEIPWRVQVLDNWDTLHAGHRPLSLPVDIGPQRDKTLPLPP